MNIFTALLVGALVVYAALMTILLLRTRHNVLRIVDDVESNTPCSNPGCIAARIGLRNAVTGP